MKLKEGQKVYYLIGGFVESGQVIDLEKKPYGYICRLDSYGGCEGQYTIDESQICMNKIAVFPLIVRKERISFFFL